MVKNHVRILGVDPALSNMGLAFASLDLQTDELILDDLRLVQTDSQKGKTVRQSSDDLRRAQILAGELMLAQNRADIVIAEIPTGTQSARGAMSNGIALGVIAGAHKPLIQVNPTEVKMASVGIKTATKSEMIEWAMKKYPSLPWLMRKSKGEYVPMNDNEHLADAVAIIVAGMQTAEFKNSLAMMKATLRILR